MATKNIPISTPGVMMLPFVFPGANTATLAARVRFDMPFPVKLLSVQASARASSGTNPTLTVDAQVDGASVLDAPIDVTAGATAEGAIADDRIADEAEITLDFAVGGTDTPTFEDVTVLLALVRI